MCNKVPVFGYVYTETGCPLAVYCGAYRMLDFNDLSKILILEKELAKNCVKEFREEDNP